MNIKMLIMDVDGTLTDGKVYLGESGEELKAFNIKDGLGIVKLHKRGIVTAIITGRQSKIVERRAKELSIAEVYQNVNCKAEVAKYLIEKYGVEESEVAYIGDDENDIDVMRMCGVVGCPADAVESVKEISSFIAMHDGGNGAVRDFAEWLMD